MRALIVTTMRNEGPYILEWLAHHRAVGFTDFLVFSNDCDDGTDALLDRLHELGQIVHCRTKKGDRSV
ncbi:MAG: glycosyltransferase family 2 protein, partial [Pseudomonadota bacterium]